jgi:hypothetical protein
MPLHAHALGESAGSIEVRYDARWTMAYASGVPDERPELYDTVSGVVVHPLFPVAPEWELIIAQRSARTGMTDDEVRRGIHVGHDLHLARPLRAGEHVRLEGRIIGVDRRRAGATQEILFTATDEHDAVVWRTRFTSLFLGVELEGEAATLPIDWPATPTVPTATEPLRTATSTVRTIDAHVYSECARIWNPIHTDMVAANRAGLPAPILHGTATLARSVSLAADLAGVPLASVRRVSGGFRTPVALGSSFDVRLLGHTDHHLWFDAVNPDGSTALTNGLLGLSPRNDTEV